MSLNNHSELVEPADPAHGSRVPASALDDAALYRETVIAFRRWRNDPADVDAPLLARLVELQHEYLSRFPGMDIPVLIDDE